MLVTTRCLSFSYLHMILIWKDGQLQFIFEGIQREKKVLKLESSKG